MKGIMLFKVLDIMKNLFKKQLLAYCIYILVVSINFTTSSQRTQFTPLFSLPIFYLSQSLIRINHII